MDENIHIYQPNQVWDFNRAKVCFRIGLRILGSKKGERRRVFRGHKVHTDKTGQKFIISGIEKIR